MICIKNLKKILRFFKYLGCGHSPRHDIVLIDNFKKRVTDKSSVVKIVLKISSFDKAREVKSFIDKNYTNIKSYLVRDGDHYLVEIISNKASKSLMIEKIVETENIKNKDVYTIGDGINDVDMVRDYNGYRVKNSCDELNTITNKVVDSVNDLINRLSNYIRICLFTK